MANFCHSVGDERVEASTFVVDVLKYHHTVAPKIDSVNCELQLSSNSVCQSNSWLHRSNFKSIVIFFNGVTRCLSEVGLSRPRRRAPKRHKICEAADHVCRRVACREAPRNCESFWARQFSRPTSQFFCRRSCEFTGPVELHCPQLLHHNSCKKSKWRGENE